MFSRAAAAVFSLALCADALVINFRSVDQEVSPMVIAIVVAVVISVLVTIFVVAKSRGDGYRAFGAKSGMSASSSDMTSSETGSTDRELKSRMERFEKRLEEHKKMLEKKSPDDQSSVTDSDADSTTGPWMKM